MEYIETAPVNTKTLVHLVLFGLSNNLKQAIAINIEKKITGLYPLIVCE